MSDQIKTALELHAQADEAALARIDERFEHLHETIVNNHKELLVAVTEMKAANSNGGIKSGLITSGVLVSIFEAAKQLLMK